ncbi:HAD family phosphatase [bacterium]|nr:HAD family phosphatase [bacterium]
MIKAILFDIGDVLVDVKTDSSLKKIEKLGPHISKKNLKLIFSDSRAFDEFEKGFISSYEFYIKILKELKTEFAYEEFIDLWCDIFFDKPESYKLLTKLKSMYKLGLLSNTNSLHIEFLKNNYNFFKLIDYEFYSYVLHSAKPDKAIYEKAILKTGFLPAELLFIDNKEENVIAAESAGMKSLRYESYEKLVKDFAIWGIEM